MPGRASLLLRGVGSLPVAAIPKHQLGSLNLSGAPKSGNQGVKRAKLYGRIVPCLLPASVVCWPSCSLAGRYITPVCRCMALFPECFCIPHISCRGLGSNLLQYDHLLIIPVMTLIRLHSEALEVSTFGGMGGGLTGT